MKVTSRDFVDAAHRALGDRALQKGLQQIELGFVEARTKAISSLPEFESLRDRATEIKDHTIANLADYLEQYEARVVASGGQVHWAADDAEACAIVGGICADVGAQLITKSKSMVTEEIELNPYLEAQGFRPVETDLGEYIIQLRNEKPSHIVAPVIHLSKDRIADTFYEAHRKHGFRRRLIERADLVQQARQVLRKSFMTADVGITGANFLIAETGTAVLVTNEGNADLVTTVPDTHIVVTGIEKLVPTLDDTQILLRLLARSATGQATTSYVSYLSGPRQKGEISGPSAFHVVLVDNGRSAMIGTEFQDILRCIRCGACLNHCPVYANIGGHAYGSVYPGPLGAVLTPQLAGIDQSAHLPNASTFCGKCEEVCPVRIPLPKLMRYWRDQEYAQHLAPSTMRAGLGAWAWLSRHPTIYRSVFGIANRGLNLFSKTGWAKKLPGFAGNWTGTRDLRIPADKCFQQQWRARPKAGQ